MGDSACAEISQLGFCADGIFEQWGFANGEHGPEYPHRQDKTVQ